MFCGIRSCWLIRSELMCLTLAEMTPTGNDSESRLGSEWEQSIRCLILIRCHPLPQLQVKSHSPYAKTRDTIFPVATGNGRFSLSRSSVCGSIPIAANIVAARSPNGTGSRSGYAPFLSLTP